MRARRLRRLGVASAGSSLSETSRTETLDSQKNDVKTSARHEDELDEKDENLHKQKQQKFDETIDTTCTETALNNNDSELGKSAQLTINTEKKNIFILLFALICS